MVDDAIEVGSVTAEAVPEAESTPTEALILEAALVQEAMDTKEPVITLLEIACALVLSPVA